MKQGLGALPNDDRLEISQRFAEQEGSMTEVRSSMASPGP